MARAMDLEAPMQRPPMQVPLLDVEAATQPFDEAMTQPLDLTADTQSIQFDEAGTQPDGQQPGLAGQDSQVCCDFF